MAVDHFELSAFSGQLSAFEGRIICNYLLSIDYINYIRHLKARSKACAYKVLALADS
jgi:hypothetical protein